MAVDNNMGRAEDRCKLTLKGEKLNRWRVLLNWINQFASFPVPKNYRRPVFVEKLRANLTDEGMVSFECKVVGFPTPILTWLKDGQDLRPGDVYQVQRVNFSLLIVTQMVGLGHRSSTEVTPSGCTLAWPPTAWARPGARRRSQWRTWRRSQRKPSR